MKIQVKGSIEKIGATAFDRGMFNAGLFSQGKLLGEGPVDENGLYNFTIEAAEPPTGVELALYPVSVKAEDAGIMAIRRSVPQAVIKAKKKDLVEIFYNVSLPKFFLEEKLAPHDAVFTVTDEELDGVYAFVPEVAAQLGIS